jgi:hypothetical protein
LKEQLNKKQEGDACTTTLRQGKVLKLIETQKIITLG